MAGVTDPSIRNATRVQFDRIFTEFQTSMNPIKKWFSMESTLAFQKYFDYMNKVEYGTTRRGIQGPETGVDDTTASAHTARRIGGTPTAQIPTWRRRVNNYVEADIHVAIPRHDAKRLGLTHEKLITSYKGLIKKAMGRKGIQMMLELITGVYDENPVIADQSTARTRHVFDDASEHMFANDTTQYVTPGSATTKAGIFAAPPLIEHWYYLTEALAEARQIGVAREGQLSGDTGVSREKKCLVICSNRAFTHWKTVNARTIGDRELFGTDVFLGEGKVYDFQEYSIMSIPNMFLPPRTSEDIVQSEAKGKIRFPRPSSWGAFDTPLLTATSSGRLVGQLLPGGAATNDPATTLNPALVDINDDKHHCSIVGLEQMLVLEPNAFRFHVPTQMIVKPKQYQDFTKSMETFVFGLMGMEGIRLFDTLARRVWVTGANQIGKYVDDTI